MNDWMKNIHLNHDHGAHCGHDHDHGACGHDHHHHMPFQKDFDIGRNDPCLCGSGQKYKKCCLKVYESALAGTAKENS